SSGLRINRLAYLCDLGGRESAQFSVFLNDRLIFGQIHAEHFVGRNKGFLPLNIGTKLLQHLIRFMRRFPQLLFLQRPDLRNLSLNHIFLPNFLLLALAPWPYYWSSFVLRLSPINSH